MTTYLTHAGMGTHTEYRSWCASASKAATDSDYLRLTSLMSRCPRHRQRHSCVWCGTIGLSAPRDAWSASQSRDVRVRVVVVCNGGTRAARGSDFRMVRPSASAVHDHVLVCKKLELCADTSIGQYRRRPLVQEKRSRRGLVADLTGNRTHLILYVSHVHAFKLGATPDAFRV